MPDRLKRAVQDFDARHPIPGRRENNRLDAGDTPDPRVSIMLFAVIAVPFAVALAVALGG